MSETDKNVWSLLSSAGINFSTLIYAATIAAGLWANWQIQDQAVKDIKAEGKNRSDQIAALSIRLYAVERDMATMTVRYETLRDAVIELRRQSRLTTPVPQ